MDQTSARTLDNFNHLEQDASASLVSSADTNEGPQLSVESRMTMYIATAAGCIGCLLGGPCVAGLACGGAVAIRWSYGSEVFWVVVGCLVGVLSIFLGAVVGEAVFGKPKDVSGMGALSFLPLFTSPICILLSFGAALLGRIRGMSTRTRILFCSAVNICTFSLLFGWTMYCVRTA